VLLHRYLDEAVLRFGALARDAVDFGLAMRTRHQEQPVGDLAQAVTDEVEPSARFQRGAILDGRRLDQDNDPVGDLA
jgi:hypothetical protein